MSEISASQPDEVDDQPAMLGRIRPIAIIFFGAWAVGMILTIAYTLVDAVRDMWHLAGR
jgi:hypothetical protein